MAKKKTTEEKNSNSKKDTKKKADKKSKQKKTKKAEPPTLKLKTETDIAYDFAVKAYKKFDKIIKSVILFGSEAKKERVTGSDIDIVIIIDDVSIKWDQELIAWYREELDKILRKNPYQQSLHINTIKLSTWWEDILKGEPAVLNTLRHGQSMVDSAGFFQPLKYLLLEGKIKPSPEAIYTCLQRAPSHLTRSYAAELGSIEGIYWTMVDSAHAALIAINVFPASPQHIPVDLRNNFVEKKMLKQKYLDWYKEILSLHKKISHGEIKHLKGVEVDKWQERADEFLSAMSKLVKQIIEK